jgi:LPS-assembly lipoprotein
VVALLLAAGTPLLSACGDSGFRPLYASSGVGANVDERLAQVDVAPIPGRVGQRIRNELIFQATGGGAALPPTLRLEVAIRESVTSTLVRQDGNADAQVYGLEAHFNLVRVGDNSVVLKGTSFARAGFERFESIFSNVRAREDAENRAARTIGDDLKSRLVAYLAKPA